MRTRRTRSALERSDLSQAWEGFISRFNEVTTDSTEDIDITRRNYRQTPVRSSNHGLRNVVVAVVMMSAVLMFLNFALKVGNVTIGVLYPTWQTFKALEARKPESEDDEDDETYYPVELYRENWGSYWIVAGIIFGLETLFLRPTIGAFLPAPIYPALIFLSLVYLTKNNAESSRSLYVDLARPALVSMEGAVDKAAKTVMNRVEYYTGQILIHLHSVVEPYARQLNHAAAASRRQLREQEEPDEQPAVRHRRGWR